MLVKGLIGAPKDLNTAQAPLAPATSNSGGDRQAGGRNGAEIALEWKDLTTNVKSGSEAPQEDRGSDIDNVAACGTAQPQSQLMSSQQLPSGIPAD